MVADGAASLLELKVRGRESRFVRRSFVLPRLPWCRGSRRSIRTMIAGSARPAAEDPRMTARQLIVRKWLGVQHPGDLSGSGRATPSNRGVWRTLAATKARDLVCFTEIGGGSPAAQEAKRDRSVDFRPDLRCSIQGSIAPSYSPEIWPVGSQAWAHSVVLHVA